MPSDFHFKWSFDPAKRIDHCPGIKIEWNIENVERRELVSNELSATVSTPDLGNVFDDRNYIANKHEYTAVINMPNNITDILDDAALVVDIDVTITQPGSGVELWTSGFWIDSDEINWKEAELFCLSKGGHLASAKSLLEWQDVQALLVNHNNLSLSNHYRSDHNQVTMKSNIHFEKAVL